MTLLALARLCAFWSVMNASPVIADDPGAMRIYTSPTTHVGVRFHSDAIGDEAITVQCTATWLSL